jgi:nitrous oxide reductase accessory protein NosL
MKKPLIALAVTIMVAGCSTLKTDQAIPLLQAETAKMLGLGSSDEITVTQVNGAQPDALGGQKLTIARPQKKAVFLIAHP